MSDVARDSGLTFFLDRGLGSRIVPRALREEGWIIETMDERYGVDASQHIEDVRWIEEATIRGDVLLCKDLAIARNPIEARVVYMSAARVFALANARVTAKEMIDRFLSNEARIVHAAKRVTPPFVFAVTADGLPRARLRYPVGGSGPLNHADARRITRWGCRVLSAPRRRAW